MRNVAVYRFVVFASVVLMLSGCGTNIFKGLDSTSHGTAAEQARDAADKGDYTLALAQANKVLENGNSTVEEKIDANNIIGGSILAKNGITVLDVGVRILEFKKGTISSENGENANDNIVAALKSLVATISTADMEAAAEAFNNAADLQSTLGSESVGPRIIVPQTIDNVVLSPTLNKSVQFRRGVANATVVVKMATLYLDISVEGQGSVVLNSNALGLSITPRDVVLYLGARPRSVFYYANNAVDAFTKSNVLSNGQLNGINSLKDVGTELDSLYTAALTNSSYQGPSHTTHVFSSGSQDEINAAYLSALNDIFKNTLRK